MLKYPYTVYHYSSTTAILYHTLILLHINCRLPDLLKFILRSTSLPPALATSAPPLSSSSEVASVNTPSSLLPSSPPSTPSLPTSPPPQPLPQSILYSPVVQELLVAAFTDLQLLQLIPIWNVLSDLIYYKYDKKSIYPTSTTTHTPTDTHTHKDSTMYTYVYTYIRDISCINHNIVPIITALVTSHLRSLSPVLVNVAVIKRFFDKVS